MNYRLVFKLIGNILKLQAVFMACPLIVSIIYDSGDMWAFGLSIMAVSFTGYMLSFLKPKSKKFTTKDAFAATSLTWTLISLFGALPFYFSGYFPSFISCVFESVSGFTTTGATILTDIEALPKGIAFWRSFSHWIGGMGVLMFVLAVMPSMNASSVNLISAEAAGPSITRILPKIRETARFMYMIYISMSVVMFVMLLMTGMPAFDAMTTTFSTSGTGGFSVMNDSIGAYNNLAAEIIISVFMFLFGVSFSMYYYAFVRNFKAVYTDEELRFYVIVTISAILIITLDISSVYGSASYAFREAVFQVTTIISTTGFFTTNYAMWPTFSRFILIMLMFFGCCAGSTGGGIKLIRLLILVKAVKVELGKIIHPRGVKIITINGKRRDDAVITKVALYFFTYVSIFALSVALISFHGYDMITSVTAVIATLSNVGPGFGLIGPIESYGIFSDFSKIILSVCMLAGRLEFFPVLILFIPSLWRADN